MTYFLAVGCICSAHGESCLQTLAELLQVMPDHVLLGSVMCINNGVHSFTQHHATVLSLGMFRA